MINDELKQRLKRFITEVGVPMTRIGRDVQLSTMSIYRWMDDKQNLSDDAKERIDQYLAKLNY